MLKFTQIERSTYQKAYLLVTYFHLKVEVLQLLTQVSESQLLKKHLRMLIVILTKLCT